MTTNKTPLVMASLIRPLVEPRLPDWVEPHWFMTRQEAMELAPMAEVGWFDMYDKAEMFEVISAAKNLKWLNSIYAGVDGMPLKQLARQGTAVTNGVGINAISIAEYVVMGMLNIAKDYRSVMRAAERQEWLQDSPGKQELFDSKALLLGYGAIGKLLEERLIPFGVEVIKVRRKPGEDTLTPNQWRGRLGEFDWVILAVPATAETDGMIGTEELSAMKNTASLINIARGSVVEQEALVNAMNAGEIGSAWLDVTEPEPLPAEHPLWQMDNVHISMHLSGRAQDKMFMRSADRFIENLERYGKGETLEPQVNLELGY